jgi:hypothetical protein
MVVNDSYALLAFLLEDPLFLSFLSYKMSIPKLIFNHSFSSERTFLSYSYQLFQLISICVFPNT